jgi:hypothetical protein
LAGTPTSAANIPYYNKISDKRKQIDNGEMSPAVDMTCKRLSNCIIYFPFFAIVGGNANISSVMLALSTTSAKKMNL